MSKKMDYTHGRFTILTNEVDYDEWRQEYEDFCEDMGLKKSEVGFRNWVEEAVQMDFESDLENIRNYGGYNVPVVLHGTLGLWWGRPEIKPMRFDSVYDALRKCIDGGDIVKAEYNDGDIWVRCSHHDGTNSFIIRALSKRGQAKVSDDFKHKDYKRLKYLYA